MQKESQEEIREKKTEERERRGNLGVVNYGKPT